MVLALALNAALDVTYEVERLSRGEAVRVRTVHTRPGGKGVNVASVLAALGTEVTLTGLVGGCRGGQIRELLTAGLRERFVSIEGESRQTVVAIADDGSFAEYDEPGPVVSRSEWERFMAEWPGLLKDCSTVVLAGSLPGGMAPSAYGILTSEAHQQGRLVVLDTGGAALSAGIASGPDLVKLNRSELAAHAGFPLPDDTSVIKAAETIRAGGAGAVIATLGPDGAIAIGEDWGYRVSQPARGGSPVGAGDAFTAGLVAAEASPPERLAFAAALAASAVGLKGAGTVDLAVARQLLDVVEVVPL